MGGPNWTRLVAKSEGAAKAPATQPAKAAAAPTWSHARSLRSKARPCPNSPRRAESGTATAERYTVRSEERRVGKEWRSRWSPYHLKKKKKRTRQRKSEDNCSHRDITEHKHSVPE